MDGTVIHNQPFFSILILFHLIYLFKKLLYKIKVFIFSICTFNYTPVCQSLLTYNCYQWKSFSLRNGTVYSDLLIGPCPCLLTCHIEIETRLVKEVYFGIFVSELFILRTEFISLLERLGCISLFRNTTNSFLSEFTNFKQPCYCSFIDLLPMSIFQSFQVLNFIQLHT